MSARFSALLALAVALFASSGAHAYTASASKWNPSMLPISYRINLSSAPMSIGSSGAQTAVDQAFATWAEPACTTWRATNGGTSTRTRAGTGDSERSILWINGAAGSWPSELGSENSTIGVTTPVWRSGGYFIDADIQFNGVGFRWSATGTGGTVDTQTIALHEEGHFLGLDHSSVRSAVMFASYSGGTNRALNADDQAGVCALYPSGTAPPPDAGVPSDAGSSGSGGVGDSCSMTVACASGNICGCRSATDCFCTRMCSASNPCPSTATCQRTGMGNYCFPGGGSTMPGGGTTGSDCTDGSQCSSGVCVTGGGRSFCSQVCMDDCSCPPAYTCFATTTAGTSVCAPGTNTCATTEDAGTETPDAATEEDAGTETPVDAGRDGGTTVPMEGTCGCAVPGGGHGARGVAALVAAMAAAMTARRKRR